MVQTSAFDWPYAECRNKLNMERRYIGPQHLTGSYTCFPLPSKT